MTAAERARPATFDSYSDIVDRLFDRGSPVDARGVGGPAGFQSLPVNVWEGEDGYRAAVLAPGLDARSIRLTVHGDTLAIEAEARPPAHEGARLVWQEFGPATYRRTVRLGRPVDPARVEAAYRDGVLHVTLPKAEATQPRRIEIRRDDSPSTPAVPHTPVAVASTDSAAAEWADGRPTRVRRSQPSARTS